MPSIIQQKTNPLNTKIFTADYVKQLLATTLAGTLVRVTLAGHANCDARTALFAFYLARQRVAVVAIILSSQSSQAAGLLAAFRFASAHHGWNDETDVCPLQVRDHLDAEKALVQQQISDFYPSPSQEAALRSPSTSILL